MRLKQFIRSIRKMGLSSLFFLCTVAAAQTEPFQAARQIAYQPMVIKPHFSPFKLQVGNEKALESAYQTYLKTGKAPNIIMEGFVVFAYGAEQPIISASPFSLSVISLEPGERVASVSSGDPMRWSYSLVYSGSKENRQAHVMVKPSMSNISTDLVITTNKRFYTLKLVAKQSAHYYRDVRFWYPGDIQHDLNKAVEKELNKNDEISSSSEFDISHLNFNYKIKTPFFRQNPRWYPVRIFDDGHQTYIQFPQVERSDLPALFIQNQAQKQIVNYRIKSPYFIIDQVFRKALLISGCRKYQETLTLINQKD